ncbi:DEAD/DEAH box helicase [Aeribacillus composti]|uniref:DEAD/DEAH box helicase n=1 Tax=Aeribacillus composti TaxID=1868734 RepID=UPI00119B4B0A|nr:DEAD/DEAH box helicase [Aeribacillus composti]TVZ79627.1 replicative superfamily II helicase [Aeribacillus composti]
MSMKVPNHWLINTLVEQEFIESIKIADYRLIKASLSDSFFSCKNNTTIINNEKDNALIQNVLDILELAIIELQNKKLETEQEKQTFYEICQSAFILLRALPLPENEVDKIKFVYKLVAYSYLGQRWQDGRRFLLENSDVWDVDSNEEEWDLRLFKKIYLAFLYLVRKSDWKDLTQASSIITELRDEQQKFESLYLQKQKIEYARSSAFELIGLYHLAKAIDVSAEFMINGNPINIREQLDFHFEKAIDAAEASSNIEMGLVIKLLQSMLQQMIANSVWMVTQRVNSRVTKFVEYITKSNKPIFELLYPQRRAILEKGLLDPAHKAIVVDMPTSSGKTALAEFRILQALNQFSDDKGWVAYVVPTRALVNQVTNRLRRDFSPIGIKVEKVSGSLDLDLFEENLIHQNKDDFDVLVTTTEKLNLLIRNGIEKELKRPLALAVIDEAHNLEDETRGLNYEILMANIKNDCPKANFLLLTPFIPNSKELASWLDPDSPNDISIGLSWQPNDRLIGAIYPEGEGRKWKTKFETLLTDRERIQIEQKLDISSETPMDIARSSLTKSKLAVAATKQLINRKGILLICQKPRYCWNVAKELSVHLDDIDLDDELILIKKFIEAELGEDFILSRLLDKGIGVHHSGIPDEIRFLMEQLMEKGKLRVLVATTTIAQGINFPVSTIIMASYRYPYKKMPTKDFWNLVGRAGRADQGTLGVVGIVIGDEKAKKEEELNELKLYLKQSTKDLVSRLVEMVNDLEKLGDDKDLGDLLYIDSRWSQFLQYLAHMYNQTKDLDSFSANAELFLRRTFGFHSIDPSKRKILVKKVREYAQKLDTQKSYATLSDSTGFSPEAVAKTISAVNKLKLTSETWNKSNLFSSNGKLKDLMGVMLTIPEIKGSLEEIATNGGTKRKFLADIISDWVSGKTLDEISRKYFNDTSEESLTECCRAIYSKIVNAASWGMSSIIKLPVTGIDFDKLVEEEKMQIKNLPSMIYYGVNSSEAVLMRSSNVPRSIAEEMGQMYKNSHDIKLASSVSATAWINSLKDEDWNKISANKKLSGVEYKEIWKKLNGQ